MDFLNPDYAAIFRRRIELLRKIRDPETGPQNLAVLKAYYKLHPWVFVRDWGMTYDPRLTSSDAGMATIPFIPFDRQHELMQWIVASWKGKKNGIVPKSRDTGASWCAIALSCTLCLFYPGMAIGFGSRKEEYVDRLDSPKSLFFKARVFMKNLPREFRGGWDESRNGTFMRITFPESGAVMTGEAGDNIGRGDRTSIYFVDESAHLERPRLAEAALTATTDCRIDMSSVNGMGNPFAEKAHSWPEDRIFILHWRMDPRRTQEWYDELCATEDPRVVAQEYDINYSASVTGVVIPSEWVRAAIDAHVKLGIEPSGARRGALDVADEGPDLNALVGRQGILLNYAEAFSGKGSDIMATTERAIDTAESERWESFRYDADGLGAGVKGDARVTQQRRGLKLDVSPFRGSGGVVSPDKLIEQIDPTTGGDKLGRLNKDYYANAKAQAWWSLRLRFQRTYRAVTTGVLPADLDSLISISGKLPSLVKLCAELSQPTYSENGAGKLLIDKAPDGAKSPNLADGVMIAYAPAEPRRRGVFDIA